MVNSDFDWVIVGRFGRVHGIQGFIKVHSFTQDPSRILEYKDWHRCEKGTWIPTDRLAVDNRHRSIVVKIDGFETREVACDLTNLDIAVHRTELPNLQSDEFYHFELIGMEVMNTQHIRLGTVEDVLSTGANDVLVIKGERRRLIPYLLDQVIKAISRETRSILVDWDEDF